MLIPLGPYAESMSQVLVALLLGAAIGFERQLRQRLAGLRTNALVALGAAAFVIIAALTDQDASPTRMAAQVVSGIGFLCAGVIMKEGLSVRGLNTAATLWCSAAVGALSGSGFLLIATLVAAMVITANITLRWGAQVINTQPFDATSEVEQTYTVRMVCRAEDEARMRAVLLQAVSPIPLNLRGVFSTDLEGTPRTEILATLTGTGRPTTWLEQIVGRLSLERSVTEASWTVNTSVAGDV